MVGGLGRQVGGLARAPRLALARVQQLEDARDVLRVRADHVALRHRAHVEHLAATPQHTFDNTLRINICYIPFFTWTVRAFDPGCHFVNL